MAFQPGLPRAAFQYSFAQVQCIVGLVHLNHFGDDGGIEFEYATDLVEGTTSADGFRTYTATNDESVKVTLTLKPHSRAIPELDKLVKNQVATIGLKPTMTPVPFFFLDPSTGSTVASEYVVFMSEPTQNASKSVTDRVYVIDLPYARFRQLFSPTLIVPTP